jgi:hypothetical protein
MTGLHRLAVTVAMYSTARTPARPPKIIRRPRHWPESRLNGQTPTRAPFWRRSSVPSSGKAARRFAAVTGSMPGTPRRRSSRSRQMGLARSHIQI